MFIKYFTCNHWLWFDRFGDRSRRTEPSRFHGLLLERGLLHEERLLAGLEYEPVGDGDEDARFARTQELMAAGTERIYHGLLRDGDLIGEPDLLERRDGRPSRYGSYSYEPTEIKSAERITDAMRLQLAMYGDLLERVQGARPEFGYILNASGVRIGCQLDEVEELYRRVLGELRELLSGRRPGPRLSSGCRVSPWFSECIALAESTNDITLLYNIKAKTLEQLRELGIRSVEDAADMDPDEVHGRNRDIKLDLLRRAKLQAAALIDRQHVFRRPVSLPESPTEIFFDIESDPLRGVDYLFGFLVRDGSGERYERQLAESPEGEEGMWREFLRWLSGLPGDYAVYHFGTFELVRLNALESRYGGSAGLDTFRSRLVDLNETVKDSVVLPLYFYGIKDIGKYIGFDRQGEIAGGGESVAVYERWLETGDRAALDSIVEYNRDDVVATRELKDWLVRENARFFGPAAD